MAKPTIEYGQCLNAEPHESHKFRPAIFGVGRKVICRGVKVPTPPHKHKYILQDLSFIDPRKLVWHCDCGKFCSMFRKEFHKALKDPNLIPIKAN